jgi:hypothetical protein
MGASNEKLSFSDTVAVANEALLTGKRLSELGIIAQETLPKGVPHLDELGDILQSSDEEFLAFLKNHKLGDLENLVQTTSWETLQSKTGAFATSISQNFKFLGCVLDRHEATIHRRWLKKTNKRRRTIILEAWGTNMPSSHRPDFAALELESDDKRMDGSDYRDSYLWPYINVEDLCKSRSLLLLMSTRGRYHPSELAFSKFEAHSLGRCAYIFPFVIGEGIGDHRMDLTSHGGDDAYGRMWNRNTHPERFSALRSRIYQYPAYDFLVLEAQERVLSFLANCVKLILHDFTEDSMLQSPIQPPVSLSRPDSGYASLATIAAEAPYQQPNSLDFPRIAPLLAAKHDEIADHLWSMREDPGYYEAQMLEVKEHRRELLADMLGRQHPICSPEHEDKFWARVVSDQISYAYFQLEVFANLVSQAKVLGDLQDSHADAISMPSSLSKAYRAAIMEFRHLLLRAAHFASAELSCGFDASPPMRQHHKRKYETDPTAEVSETTQHKSFKEDPVRQQIYWLLLRLWKGDSLFEMIGLPNIVDELQRLIYAEPAKNLISPYLASVVGALAILSECFHQMDLYQPWSQKNYEVSPEERDRLLQQFVTCEKRWADMFRSIDSHDYELGTLGGPTNGKFAYPVSKRRTRENVETMRSAEKNLDKFWHKLDQDMMSKSSGLGGSAVHHLLTQGRPLQRIPAWVEPVREKVQPPIEELYIPFSQLSFNDERSNDQDLHESFDQPPKEKIKTRKNGNSEDVAGDADAVTPPTEAKPASALNLRALKVFKTVFFTPSVTSEPGEVAWADFLYAMVSVGFNPEKLYGSVWQFSPDPDKLDAERSIQFHEPHG